MLGDMRVNFTRLFCNPQICPAGRAGLRRPPPHLNATVHDAGAGGRDGKGLMGLCPELFRWQNEPNQSMSTEQVFRPQGCLPTGAVGLVRSTPGFTKPFPAPLPIQEEMTSFILAGSAEAAVQDDFLLAATVGMGSKEGAAGARGQNTAEGGKRLRLSKYEHQTRCRASRTMQRANSLSEPEGARSVRLRNS